jgi:hypothetical protein
VRLEALERGHRDQEDTILAPSVPAKPLSLLRYQLWRESQIR